MSVNTQPQQSDGQQESVWDYPRPPAVRPTDRHVRVVFNGVTIAETRRAIRVLETSHPPVYYIPPDDVQIQAYCQETSQQTLCEFKGIASYYSVTVGDRTSENAAWFYPGPLPGYEAITGYVAFYPGRVDACYVDDEKVQPETGAFYGGWITHEIV